LAGSFLTFPRRTRRWCITAAQKAQPQEFGNSKLQPCDFNFPHPNQLWFLPFNSEDSETYSGLDDSKCITVNIMVEICVIIMALVLV
jgi:hypothetical protein